MDQYHSGYLTKQGSYSSFEPSEINREWAITDPRVLEAMSKADRQLGRLDMFSEHLPNLDLFVQMHVTKEATKSSKIENTVTEMEEAVLPEDEIEPERRDDWQEVTNYILAIRECQNSLEEIPFSVRILKNAHQILMAGVRGEHKQPGEFRISQNWIGGSNPGNARFVPPIHENVPQMMSDLEKFAHNEELHLPPLIKIGVMHYQFETIHPFLDGNGRIGRLMVPLFLISEGILKEPVLYLSDYLEKHREEYYDRLTQVRDKGDMNGWLLFFLDGVAETASKGVQTFNEVLRLKEHWEREIRNWSGQSSNSLLLFHQLFKQPWATAKSVMELASVSSPTAYKIIGQFQDAGLLKEMTGSKRNRVFLFEPYMKLFRG